VLGTAHVYEYCWLWPAVKFCPPQTLVAAALPDWSNTCISTFPFVRPDVPVSLTVTAITVDAPTATLDGVAVAEEVKVSDELTVMLAADAFQLHCCQVALNTPTSTVNVPATEGVKASVYFWD